jgi:TetR/AcrR family transcriptional regulator, transcriptional repressor for nem operon
VPRPRSFVEEDAVAAAGEVFARNGYGGTTFDDLVTATGVGKQSLYNTFGGKRELFLRALSARTTDAVAAVNDALAGPRSTPLERIRAQMLRLAMALSAKDREESLLTSATVELGYRDQEVATSARAAFKNLAAIYESCIVDAQESGEVDPAADAKALAIFFVTVTRGMEVLAHAGGRRKDLTAAAMTSLAAIPLTDEAPEF